MPRREHTAQRILVSGKMTSELCDGICTAGSLNSPVPAHLLMSLSAMLGDVLPNRGTVFNRTKTAHPVVTLMGVSRTLPSISQQYITLGTLWPKDQKGKDT